MSDPLGTLQGCLPTRKSIILFPSLTDENLGMGRTLYRGVLRLLTISDEGDGHSICPTVERSIIDCATAAESGVSATLLNGQAQWQ